MGPYDNHKDRRSAALELKESGRYTQVLEIDAHKEDFYAHIVPREPAKSDDDYALAHKAIVDDTKGMRVQSTRGRVGEHGLALRTYCLRIGKKSYVIDARQSDVLYWTRVE
jgi:hypothetical protein